MRITTHSRLNVLPIALAAAIGGAAVSHVFSGRSAHAQPQASIATIYAPPDGIIFRSLDGRPIARLARDVHGGILELYDEHDEVATRLSGDEPRIVRPSAPAAPAAARVFTLDDQNPWVAEPQAVPRP
jgi:hypothetical protein